MTVQYLVTAYGNQMHLARLVRRLADPRTPSRVAVQWDGSKERLTPLISALPVDVIEVPWAVNWGDATYLDAILRSMRMLRDSEWLVLLSGQDYPLRPAEEFHDLLATAEFAGILKFRQIEPGSETEEQRRYYYRHHWLPEPVWRTLGGARGVGRAMNMATRLPAMRAHTYFRPRPHGLPGAFATRVRRHPFAGSTRCLVGPDYFAVRRELVEELLESAEHEPELLEYFRRTAIPTESWFHTVLARRHSRELCNHVLNHTRFEHRQHPRLLGEDDLDDAKASGRFFARKFDDSSAVVLDRIDRELLGSPAGET